MIEKLKPPLVVFLLALAFRGFVGYLDFDRFAADPDAYVRIAETISNSGVFGLTSADGRSLPTAFRPPLYPYLLSWLVSAGKVSRFAVAVTHAVVGAITVMLAFLICHQVAEQCFTHKCNAGRSCVLAACLVAVDPILVQQSTQVMTETLATALATAGIWWWMRCCQHDFGRFRAGTSSVIVLGAFFALAYLCRPTFLVWAVPCGLSLFWLPMGTRKWRLGRSLLALLPLILTVSAWTHRNWRVMGHPIWATTHGGYTLLLGNNPSFYDYLRDGRLGEVWEAAPFLNAYRHRYDGDPNTEAFWRTDWSKIADQSHREKSGEKRGQAISEFADDRVCYLAARATIDREPVTFVWSCCVRLARLWSPLPHQTAGRSPKLVILVGVFYVLLYVGVVLGLCRLGRKAFAAPIWPIWLLAITLSLVHAIYWSNLRMRAPIMPALAVIAAVTLAPRPQREVE